MTLPMTDEQKLSAILSFCTRLDNGCWELQKFKRKESGHIQVSHKNKRVYAHRFVYEVVNGVKVPKDRCVCHSCDNPACMNPDHLWVGTWGDNLRDMARKGRHRLGRLTHCKRGHPLSGDNLIVMTEGRAKRRCRQCQKEKWQREKAKRLANQEGDGHG